MTTTEKPLHIRQAEGLRALADFVEQNPGLSDHLGYAFTMLAPVSTRVDARTILKMFHDAAVGAGAVVSIRNEPDKCHVTADFDVVSVRSYASAEAMADVPVTAYTPLLASTTDGAK
ncbi:MAG TPA: hypothetical protein VJT49_16775 [Amycolatopsis sp.]|uniref:hypothetical protein n=1 Tax=Amycolatopsis sp. TaxID=37632 RepID=UPI002B4A31ED|nr:hypothetical protein [Amycolatopsis sp.]HKS46729.1 hypothetical protein [Amycolatopsis sp.]